MPSSQKKECGQQTADFWRALTKGFKGLQFTEIVLYSYSLWLKGVWSVNGENIGVSSSPCSEWTRDVELKHYTDGWVIKGQLKQIHGTKKCTDKSTLRRPFKSKISLLCRTVMLNELIWLLHKLFLHLLLFVWTTAWAIFNKHSKDNLNKSCETATRSIKTKEFFKRRLE